MTSIVIHKEKPCYKAHPGGFQGLREESHWQGQPPERGVILKSAFRKGDIHGACRGALLREGTMKPPLAVAILLAVTLHAGLCTAKDDVAPAGQPGLAAVPRALTGVGAPLQRHAVSVPGVAPSEAVAMLLPHDHPVSTASHFEPWANSPAVRANAFYVHGEESSIPLFCSHTHTHTHTQTHTERERDRERGRGRQRERERERAQ